MLRNPNSIDMQPNRDALRRAMRAARRDIPAAERAWSSRRIAILADRAGLLRPGRRIAVYRAYGHELDLEELTRRAWQRGCKVYLPAITNRRAARMEFFPFEPTTRLIPNAFGIPEPDAPRASRISVRHLDVVFTPLVAFDDRGCRLGSGAGFYDRAMKHLRAPRLWRRPKLVGCAYSQQRVEHLDASPWDVPMDAILTPHYFKHFRTASSTEN
ncbi:MAG TPA: 5-formyltetrahydrofolate cyclo-ligase [Steroidobacteraceae bacterium]